MESVQGRCCEGEGGSDQRRRVGNRVRDSTQFGKHGASIAIMGRRKKVLDSAVTALQSLGIVAVGFEGDVCKQEDAKRVVESTFQHFGRFDILVNATAGNFLLDSKVGAPVIFAMCNVHLGAEFAFMDSHPRRTKGGHCRRKTLQLLFRGLMSDFLVDIIPRDELKEEGLGITKATLPVVGSPAEVRYYYIPSQHPVGPTGMIMGKPVDQTTMNDSQQPRTPMAFVSWLQSQHQLQQQQQHEHQQPKTDA